LGENVANTFTPETCKLGFIPGYDDHDDVTEKEEAYDSEEEEIVGTVANCRRRFLDT